MALRRRHVQRENLWWCKVGHPVTIEIDDSHDPVAAADIGHQIEKPLPVAEEVR